MNDKFTLQEVFIAYKRMKNYFYYDNNNLFVRNRIADFEDGISLQTDSDKVAGKLKEKFQPIVDALDGLLKTEAKNSALRQWLSAISYKLVPKEFAKECDDSKSNFITNRVSKSPIEVSQYNIIADVPIELHVITFLWVEYVGVKLSNNISDDNYAYRINFTENSNSHVRELSPVLNIVKPYYIGYKKWRDNALVCAKRLVDDGNDVTILSLDVKRYFYSLRLNVFDICKTYLDESTYSNISTQEQKKINVLNDVLQQIHKEYHSKVKDILKDMLPDYKSEAEEEGYTALPVGLISSGILGNIYLSDFDNRIRNIVCPHYYGRYVDDMLFVFSNHFVDNNNEVDKFIQDYFCSKQILTKVTTIDNNVFYVVNENGNADNNKKLLRIQSNKIAMQHFDHKGSHAAIALFMDDISKNRSEYRFLPDEDYITHEFDNEAYDLLYQENSRKFRNILDCKQNRYGVAKFLSNQIFLSKLASNSNKSITARQILGFFRHKTAIEMYSLWERVATYFVVNEDYTSLWKCYDNIKYSINKLEYSDGQNKIIETSLRDSLLENLRISAAMAFALCPDKLSDTDQTDIKSNSCKLRFSNMLRINNIGVQGSNLTDKLFDTTVNLYSDSIQLDKGKIEYVLRLLYPTYIHFEVLNILEIYKYISECGVDGSKEIDCYANLEKEYRKYNNEWQTLFSETSYENNKKEIIQISENGEYINIHDITDRRLSYKSDKRIAIVNTKVDDENFMNIVKYHKSRCSMQRRNELCKIINDAARENSDILVMPELTVPFEWLNILAGQVKRTGMAIVTGLEYYINSSNRILNFVATILPIIDNDIATCFVHLRLKNFYSPKERIVLEGYHFNLPMQQKSEDAKYKLFHWRNCYFSVYNCFELADIDSRARYKAKVDFIIAVEYNRDTHYYSDLVGAWARDVHCFIVQVNSSDFGDSKIIMPSRTETKTLVHIQGGENSAVLVATLPIRRLRDFQLGGYAIQKDDGLFKFTPPSFNHTYVRTRLEDKDFEHKEEIISS